VLGKCLQQMDLRIEIFMFINDQLGTLVDTHANGAPQPSLGC